MASVKQKAKWVEEIEASFTPKNIASPLPFSLIIPTFNCSVSLDLTLASIERQCYSPLEVIIVDAGSQDNTHGIIAQYGPLITRVYSVADYDVAEMLNRGASLATGTYIGLLYPGSRYLNDASFAIFAEMAVDREMPKMISCGVNMEEEIWLADDRNLPLMSTLKKGLMLQPLSALWFDKKFFISIGKFDKSFRQRFDYEFFCRIAKHRIQAEKLERILIDQPASTSRARESAESIIDTWRALKKHFGWRVALKWAFTTRFIQLSKIYLKFFRSFLYERS